MKLNITALLMWNSELSLPMGIDGAFSRVDFTVDDEVIERISKKYTNGLKLVEDIELIDLYFSTGGLPAGLKPCDVMGIPDMVQVIAFEYVEEGE